MRLYPTCLLALGLAVSLSGPSRAEVTPWPRDASCQPLATVQFSNCQNETYFLCGGENGQVTLRMETMLPRGESKLAEIRRPDYVLLAAGFEDGAFRRVNRQTEGPLVDFTAALNGTPQSWDETLLSYSFGSDEPDYEMNVRNTLTSDDISTSLRGIDLRQMRLKAAFENAAPGDEGYELLHYFPDFGFAFAGESAYSQDGELYVNEKTPVQLLVEGEPGFGNSDPDEVCMNTPVTDAEAPGIGGVMPRAPVGLTPLAPVGAE